MGSRRAQRRGKELIMKTGVGYLVIIIVFLSGIYSCGSGEQPGPARKEIFAKTFVVIKEKVLLSRRFPGQVEVKNQVVLSSKISGIVTSLSVEEGTEVKKGDHLITIDDRELKRKMDALKAELEAAKKRRESIAARAAYAKANYERFSRLLAVEAATRVEYDLAKSEYDARVQEELSLAAQGKAVAAQLAELKVLLSYAEIASPVTGAVIKRYVDHGDFVNAAQPLIALDDGIAGFWFVADIDESLIKHSKQANQVQVSIPSADINQTMPPSIIVPHVMSATRTFTVKADIGRQKVRSGEYGSLYWPTGEAEKLLIPAPAVISRGDLTAVYAVSGDKAIHLRLIKTGSYFSKLLQKGKKHFTLIEPDFLKPDDSKQDIWVEVLSGLSPNETIVISDLQTVSEGDILK
jgi:RND family efflux transporter MFP subunit